MKGDLPPDDWPGRSVSRIVPSKPHRWHVQVTGKGPDALLLHGAGASSHSWAALIGHLNTSHRVIALDLPGHGWTRSPRGRARLGDVAADIANLCAQEGWAPDLVIGHSAGGAVCLELARQGRLHPRHLVIVNGALENFRGAAGWLFPVMAKMLALNPLTGLLISQGTRSTQQVRSILSSAGTELDEIGLSHYARLIQRRAHVDGTLAMMAQWSLEDLNRALPQIITPALFIHGEKDGAVAVRVAETAAATMPNAKLVVLPGIGHLSHEEAPARVAGEIDRFVTGS
ncbi:alpha/beta fold hydrolase BchO [Roseicyclus mahoneyensis]|uniref:Magnesium chelatase accessory protein n=1 Tax=Roseicyclus mahoneyensis TaxID=164332 RepID=A0A316GLS0_9RHOB|nr:alpha/beta fold hydrolase BchO [Roseicyclus mahoneyensis]PWK61536.1 magnesium chelatase accessory protein [Roseicyclus mahoneyensis]